MGTATSHKLISNIDSITEMTALLDGPYQRTSQLQGQDSRGRLGTFLLLMVYKLSIINKVVSEIITGKP